MKPFVAIAQREGEGLQRRVLVIDFVWAIDHVKAVVLLPDHRVHYMPAADLVMDKMTMDMPIGFFDWPEPVPA